MSGIYNNWYKVNNPTQSNNIVPMESGGFQKPFYFGGSSVPSTLGIEDKEVLGKGIYKKTEFIGDKKGKGIQKTNFDRTLNTHIPRYMKFI